jgi:kinesin family protein 3/17
MEWDVLANAHALSHFDARVQVLHGGENLLDKVEQLKQRSAATKTQLEVAARQQEEQRRRLEQLQLERLDLDAQYSSLEVR